MKNKMMILRLLVAAVLISCLPAFASAASNVAATLHNLSITGPSPQYASTETQICIFCHTPHGGEITGPLWNRSDLDTTGFQYYTSTTASGLVTGISGLNPESMICLACHDGSISVYEMLNYSSAGQPEHGGVGGSNVPVAYRPGDNPAIGANSDGSVFGGQLEDDHPISFSYRDVYAEYTAAPKPGLIDPTTAVASDEIRLFGGTGAGNERLECPSCHNPHEATLPNFLVMSNAGSAMCLKCHDK